MINNFLISPGLRLSQFESPDTHEVKIDAELVDMIQRLQDILKAKVEIDSGYRTIEHNEKIGGKPKSYHLQGKAADVSCPGINLLLLTIAAVLAGFPKVIAYENGNFIHVDLDPDAPIIVPRKWTVAIKLAFPDRARSVFANEDVDTSKM